MSGARSTTSSPNAALEVHMLGIVEYEQCLRLQQRLVYEISGRRDGQAALLLCEHPPLITIGRHGSRAHVRIGERELDSRRLAVRWVNRGGGCLVHAPGQLAIYPIVPLATRGLTVGDYLARLEASIVATLTEFRLPCSTRVGHHGVWSREGQLSVIGAAVKHWTTYHGAFLNVAPALPLLRVVESDPWSHASPSSLAAGRRQPNLMPSVRARLLRHLAAELGYQRYHLYTGHPLMSWAKEVERAAPARAG